MKNLYYLLIAMILIVSCNSDDTDPSIVQAVAEFSSNETNIPIEGNVSFKDLSTGEPTSWNWNFDGGTPETSKEQNPTVTYNASGTFSVSLTVTNDRTEDTEIKEGFITVFPETGLIDLTLMHNGLEREYLLYIPEIYTGEEAVPLLFSLHGRNKSKEGQYYISRFNEIADTANFILITPEATVHDNVTFWNNESDPAKADDVGFINALIDQITKIYNIDESRIYAAGSSNGGFMCFQLACRLSNKIAAVTAVKGVMSDVQMANCNPRNPTPILQLHGTSDDVVPYTGVAATLEFWRDFNETDTEPVIVALDDPDPKNGNNVEYVLFTNGLEGTMVEHFRVFGGEHDWFGEPGINYDIDASEEAWKFFSKYSLNGRN